MSRSSIGRGPSSLLDAADTIRTRLAGRGPLLVALDFDGTLTEIVDDPEEPVLPPERRRVLERIPSPGRWLAIVSGRALDDLRGRVGIERAIYVGNHGLEIAGAGLDRRYAPSGTERRLSALLASLPELEDGWIEDKALTATAHVRPREDARRHAALGAAIRAAVEAAGFVLMPGKASWEIRPAGGSTKGEAIQRLIESIPGATPERAVYIGDDETDEDAFVALSDGITARVGSPEATTAARYRLPHPDAVYRFLETLARG